MTAIHTTAIVSQGAEIDDTAEIGPYVVIGPNVRVGPGTKVGAHAVIDGYTTIGQDCRIFAGASIGLEPQDLRYRKEPTGVIIGDRVTIREYVTIHRATSEGYTEIGDECFLMNYVHIAHNCRLGRGVILANSTMMAGHVSLGDYTVMSGMCIFHQFVRVGRLVMVSGLTGTRLDLPPFTMCDGRPALMRGINVVGLRRQGITQTVRSAVKEAYRLLYRSNLNKGDAVARIECEIEPYPEIKEILDFVRSSKRGVVAASYTKEEVPAEMV
ncbi:MAG: acyl-ACP--UDP-N-acetylglucosamine O-acyltransferase [Candidatus Melainabacteria bacterium]|nr:acyl-ACP--UDP-N-acetylglucosamine O-acyltransferase [Candidatus Melainabacteria bacterium]